jgi:hypothetical protein
MNPPIDARLHFQISSLWFIKGTVSVPSLGVSLTQPADRWTKSWQH